jgi:hypothetical protein
MDRIMLACAITMLISGCLTETRYVCPDGTVAEEATKCATPTPTVTIGYPGYPPCSQTEGVIGDQNGTAALRCLIRNSPDARYCENLSGGYGRSDCLTEVAALLNDTGACVTLDGNLRLICEAAARRDPATCDKIPVAELQDRCLQTVTRLSPKAKTPMNCTDKTGDDLIWCVVYGANTPEDCLQIDDRRYPDESALCRARVTSKMQICDEIKDEVMRNLCDRIA